MRQKSNTELESRRVVPSRSRNGIGMFREPEIDQPRERRLLLDCISRNLVSYNDKTPMPSMEQIIDCVGSRPFRSKLDLTDEYHNIGIYSESVKDTSFCGHMATYDSLVM